MGDGAVDTSRSSAVILPEAGFAAAAVASPGIAVAPAHWLRIGATRYPLVLPRLKDPRLHVAAVVLTLHVLGQTGLHFQVSIPQILTAILTCAVIQVAVTFGQTRSFVWPASAMLTGSGIALILRVPTTPLGDHWTFHKWYVFAGVAAFSLSTKWFLKYKSAQIFNPSNVGLVIAFLVLGSTRVEPLDFWWAPITNPAMVLAYAVILVGGTLITARLKLLTSAAVFWVTFAGGIGVLAAAGHCFTARWSFAPVCGWHMWRILVTSPEVLIFLYFMITDPRTVPKGRVGRVTWGFLVGVACVLLMAPQTTEFGSKVALLAGLTLLTAARPFLERLFPVAGSADDTLRAFAGRVVTGGNPHAGMAGRLARTAMVVAAFVGVFGMVLVAGRSAQGVLAGDPESVLDRVPHQIDPSTFPDITVDQSVLDWNHEISGAGARDIVLVLAENLELESQALIRGDRSILEAVDHGDRLDDMEARLRDAQQSGTTVLHRYAIDDVHVTLHVPFGRQDGLSLGMISSGTVTVETYDRGGHLQSSESEPFETMFMMRRATGGRWLNVAELPADDAG